MLNNKDILVYVNNTPVYMPPSSTVMQACEKAGVVIPRFCYHDLLEIAGNCRICLVEIERSPKPIASCGLPVIDQIRIYTDTPLVKKAREGVIEFLLLNHPLDCPICDQGGECDLQNQAIAYGNTISRFYKFKRGVEDKGLGPIIKTIITRCIHCTRCIRFAWDIAGVEDLGTTLRGNITEVGTYVQKTFNSEVSGNLIDLCPVGALTSRVYAFKARPWEITSTKSIDTSDSLGSNTIIETKKSRVLRVIPRTNIEINLEWLSDKSRYAYEGNTNQRLAMPYFKYKNLYRRFRNSYTINPVIESFLASSSNLNFKVGRNLDLESLQIAKTSARRLGADIESETKNILNLTYSAFFQSSLKLNNIEKADSCLLLGVNPRSEATLANLILRKRFKHGNFEVNSFGNCVDLTYKNKNLGLKPNYLLNFVVGKHTNNLNYSKTPLIVYGDSLSIREDAYSILKLAYKYQKFSSEKNWLGCFRFPLGSNSLGKSFLGLTTPIIKATEEVNRLKVINYILGIEEPSTLKKFRAKTILETTHINNYFKNCDFLLPLQSVLEKTGSFINSSGLIQVSEKVLRFGVEPLKLVQNYVEKLKPTKSPKHFNLNLFNDSKILFNSCVSTNSINLGLNKNTKLYISPFKTVVGDMYKTDLNTATSITLAKVSANLRKAFWHFN